MIRLRFPLRDVLILAEHAIAAPDHRPTYINTVDGTTPGPALWFVGDEGLYLMSNGRPGQPHPAGGDRLYVVYADGYHTSMSKHAIADKIGGDDFVEALPLLVPTPGGTTLHAQLTEAAADGGDLFVIDVGATAMDIFIADSRGRIR
ncbi:DUF3085 domain-containing protein [Paractinoplanes rishiriensis]|uniref:Uncharacterized protein n=1 Tax=Paractinoplanes rishiriensis TaxID=1050105 RepID=A0A919N1P6_9ACTN|nr:DUF3085 domain-containing protein [Actinoplanes rishiriensis]GIF02006.1 hypothetical protein Ari01nite_94700 [Actinoplanes rishiriensis]